MKGVKVVATVLVLSGIVLLAGPYGTDAGYGGGILYAEEDSAARRPGVEANTAFALDLYGKLGEEEGNLFFSPYSISTALAMTYPGARGDTALQMAKVLHLDMLDADVVHRAFGKLADELSEIERKGGCQLSVANTLWGQKGPRFLDEFIKSVREDHRAGFHEIDFAGDTAAARQTINAWVEKETKGKIKDLVKRGVLDPTTSLVLTNAIHFKGDWAAKFEKKYTLRDAFQLGDGKTVEVLMMRQVGQFGYMATEDLQALELPYAGEELSMVVLLPREVSGLPTIEESLTPENLAKWLSQLHKQKVRVHLPKFEMAHDLRLGEVLQSMGMTDAFVNGSADFSAMDGTKELFLGAVIHKAFVEVNEEGTEAAAATSVAVYRGGTEDIPTFRADHPFLFLIRDTRSGSILFLGRLVNPTQ